MLALSLEQLFKKGKRFRDPIYGFVFIPQEIVEYIIDTPYFQRLRWISQMSLAQMIFPGAVHTRFEHSIGTAHLASIVMFSIRNFVEKNKEFYIDAGLQDFVCIATDVEYFKELLTAAMAVAILHDIGHAPFSHTFEMAIPDYDHEEIGYVFTQKILDSIPDQDRKWIEWTKNALNKSYLNLSPEESLLRNIIDGYIDIDKGDYLLRDSYHCGVSYGWYGHERLWTNVIAIPVEDKSENITLQLGVTSKGAYEAYHLLISRFHMYQAIYEHHTKQKIDATIARAINLSKDLFKPSLKDPHSVGEEIIMWTDGYIVYNLISTYTMGQKCKIARSIMENIYRRLLPQQSETLTEIRSASVKKNLKNVTKYVRKNMWSLVENRDEVYFFPYLYIYHHPLPVDAIVKFLVYDLNRKSIYTLYDYLKMANILPKEEQEREDWDDIRVEFAVKVFTYNDDLLRNLKKDWNIFKDEVEKEESFLRDTTFE